MDRIIVGKQSSLRFKTPIILLSFTSLVFTVIGNTTYFTDYFATNDGGYYPDRFIIFLLSVIPYILFVMYLLRFHNKAKATILIPITFGLISITSLIYCFYRPKYIVMGSSGGISLGNGLLMILVAIAFALAFINSLNGFSKKTFLIIAIVAGIIHECSVMVPFLCEIHFFVEAGLHMYLFLWPIGMLGTILFYIALLLFGLTNTIPCILSSKPKPEKVETLTTEQQLKQLKSQLDNGTITEQEYRALRADIINNL